MSKRGELFGELSNKPHKVGKIFIAEIRTSAKFSRGLEVRLRNLR